MKLKKKYYEKIEVNSSKFFESISNKIFIDDFIEKINVELAYRGSNSGNNSIINAQLFLEDDNTGEILGIWTINNSCISRDILMGQRLSTLKLVLFGYGSYATSFVYLNIKFY